MSVSSALRDLRQRRTSPQYLEEFYRQIEAEENERGAAVLAAATVETALESAISRRLPNVARVFNQLFGNQGPLATLDGKIVMAQALDIVWPLTRKNLDMIKHIRNTFAHAGVPILFSTKEIDDACNALVVPPNPQRFSPGVLVMMTARQRYSGICEATAVALTPYASGCGYVRGALIRDDAMIPMTPAPLP